jgi:nucleoside-diphosphate-sugar epimerase
VKKQKSILIIGGSGFLGYHLAIKCRKLKWKVTSISRNKPKKIRRVKGVDYKIFNTSIKKNFIKIQKKNFNYVVNLGGYINHYDKLETYKNHFVTVKNLFYFFKKKNLDCFIQVGSSAEYGLIKSPQKESDIGCPKLIYGRSKLEATKFLLYAYKKFFFPVTILRFYLIYGPKQKIDRFIPLLIYSCIKKIDFIASDGKQKRDFLYVDDAIKAIINSIRNKNCRGEIINVGSGKPITLLKIINYINKKIGGIKILLGKIKVRTDEPIINYPSIRKAKKYLNFSNLISLEVGINKTIKQYKKEIKFF